VWVQWCLVALFLVLLVGLWADTAYAQPFAYISNAGSNNVSVIETATNTVVATVPVGAFPVGVAVNPAGTRALAAELGMRPLVGHSHLGLDKLYRRTGKLKQAQEHVTLATTMYREMDMMG
jgi:YVTN family beta-propeller protein